MGFFPHDVNKGNCQKNVLSRTCRQPTASNVNYAERYVLLFHFNMALSWPAQVELIFNLIDIAVKVSWFHIYIVFSGQKKCPIQNICLSGPQNNFASNPLFYECLFVMNWYF